MKSSTERWIIQTYPPIAYFSSHVVPGIGQDTDGWFHLKFYGRLNHDFSLNNPTVFKTLPGAIRRVKKELERGGLNPKWFYRILNLDTRENIPYDIL